MAWLLTHKYPFLQAWASDSFNTFRKLNQPLCWSEALGHRAMNPE